MDPCWSTLQALPEAPSHGQSEAPVNEDTPPAEPKPLGRDTQGSIVVSLKRQAEEAGIITGTTC